MSYVLGGRGPEAPMVAGTTNRFGLEQTQQMVAASFTSATADEVRIVADACRKPGISSLRQVLGDNAMDGWLARVRDRPVAYVDSVAVLVPGPEGKPILLSMACERPRPIHDAERALWHRVAIHLGAGWRLAGRATQADAADVEAVLTTDGHVAHASGPGATVKNRELLREATQKVDRARSRSGRSDPAAALELWQGLLGGRWSLVEHFDSDGKRFMLARRNDPGYPEPAGVTRRQRQVLFYASVGLSNKEMAYALGLAENTISAHVSSGLARLGITSRTELIRIGSGLAGEALSAIAAR